MERTKLADSSPPIARPYETIQLVPVEAEGAMIDAPFRPEPAQPRGWSMRARLFVGLVLLPSFVVAVYLFLIAAHRYVSEASFIVRSAAYQGAMAAGSSQAAMLASSRGAGDLADAVNSYIKSRDMVEQLETTDDLRKILSRQESDFLYRFPNIYRRDNREELYNHFGTMVSVEYDKTSGITTIAAVTFRPDDSQALVNALLGHAEELVNRLNERMVRDAEAYAQSVVNRAQEHLVDIGLRLVKFRNAAGSVDPSRESATALEQIAQMTTELAEMQASLQQQISLSPSSPPNAPLRQRIRSYQEQIDRD
jgi:capsular polysaccharide transport system permease protein